jgi:hypothetical protein
MMSCNHRLITGLVLLCFSTLALTGCDLSLNHDPATSVTIVVSGIDTEEARQAVKSTLEDLTDGSGHMMSTRVTGSTMTTTVSPVSDIDSFVKKIDFGTIKKVDGRNIEVDYEP